MSSDLDPLARRFCRELAEDTGHHPMQWRSILIIGVRCRIRSPAMLKEIVARAVNLGWLVTDRARGVAATDEGLALVRDTPGRALRRRQRDKPRLSS
jgi:hypothetical protein